ncbi:hypothetical protein [Pseudogemmobacter bohemicus]|uniref:hypothetical protein n=1 Tax=Pseudogemmobacter bohemicus TaxID=2250708 RepID=UPI0013002224|nr:hypothetical protein [Pseudogemmobacter bohemicus]
MARKSQLEKQITTVSFNAGEKPAAPNTLTSEEAMVWDSVFLCVRSDFIPAEGYPILILYSRHLAKEKLYAKKLAELEERLDFANPENLKMIDRLSGLVEREGRAALACARSLRLTSQSLRTADQNKDRSANPAKRPWET